MDFRSAGKWLLDVILPRACPHCARDLHYLRGEPLCPACEAQLRRLEAPFCPRCGLPGSGRCGDCAGGAALHLDAARSALVFNPQLRSALHAFKYGDRDDLAGWFAGLMAEALPRFPELEGYNFLVPVPLHRSRLLSRGYNQAALLAGGLAARAGLFALDGAAERRRDTPSQTSLSKAGRRRNMDGAFAVPRPELVKGRKLLLIDDVATTLAMLDSLAGALKAAGAKAAAAFTLAREP